MFSLNMVDFPMFSLLLLSTWIIRFSKQPRVQIPLSYLSVGLAGLGPRTWTWACQFTWDGIMSINPADQQKKLQSRILLPCGSFLCSLLVSPCVTRKRFRKFKCVVDRCRAHPDSADYNIRKSRNFQIWDDSKISTKVPGKNQQKSSKNITKKNFAKEISELLNARHRFLQTQLILVEVNHGLNLPYSTHLHRFLTHFLLLVFFGVTDPSVQCSVLKYKF